MNITKPNSMLKEMKDSFEKSVRLSEELAEVKKELKQLSSSMTNLVAMINSKTISFEQCTQRQSSSIESSHSKKRNAHELV